MSKIYEALLRAEQERSALTGQPETVPPPVSHLPEPPAAQTAEAAPQPPAAALVPPQEQSHAVDLSAVTLHPWTPSLKQLPALGERGHAVEQLRSLRSRLYEFRDLNALKSILISSGRPQEGKSFIAINLAIMCARHKSSRVLLIDGDMRRSTLHTLLGASNKPGLSDYLHGKATIQQVLQQAQPPASGKPLPPGLASLAFIAAGEDTEEAAELSATPRFSELIKTLSPLFDWIIVDSSPVNLVSDAVNLLRACDGALLVVRGGVTRMEVAQKAVAELRSQNVLGVVLNAVDFTPASGYYGYDSYENYNPRKENKHDQARAEG